MTDSLQSQIDALKSRINEWAHAYYVDDDPIVSDATYDADMRELEALEQQAGGATRRLPHPTSHGRSLGRLCAREAPRANAVAGQLDGPRTNWSLSSTE